MGNSILGRGDCKYKGPHDGRSWVAVRTQVVIDCIELHRPLKDLGLSERQKPWRALEEKRDMLWFSCKESPCPLGVSGS